MALQLRLQDRARTTRDIDLHTRERAETALNLLVSAALLDLGDHLQFDVARASAVDVPLRCAVRSVLAGRVFESFHVDLGCEEERIGAVSHLPVSSLLEFAGIPPVESPCFPPQPLFANSCATSSGSVMGAHRPILTSKSATAGALTTLGP
ncbi:MAG TPA: hypothetical protein DCP20_08210 [Coriobacteriia bacterium]|nr:hypothetical protein [Coriobacteriia bacterium]